MIDDRFLRKLARYQHGVVSVDQMVNVGLSARQRQLLIDGRRWERVAPRVVRLVGSPETTHQEIAIAILEAGIGSALCGSSAAAWWGIPGNALRPLQIVRPRDRVDRPTRSASSHEPTLLPFHHIVVLDRAPVVVPARALFEVAGSRRRGAELEWWVDRVARMVDTAWSMRLVSGATLHDMLDELAQRGRPGIRVMRQVLATRGRDYVPPASGLESRVIQILARAGLPPMRRQVNIGDETRWIGRVDLVDERLPLILEIQSERFHSSLIDRQLDRVRISTLRHAGFVVVEVLDTEVWQRPDRVVEKVTKGRGTAERKLTRKAA